jgi:hypothetical protein
MATFVFFSYALLSVTLLGVVQAGRFFIYLLNCIALLTKIDYSTTSTLAINNTADALELATCTTFSGSIAVTTSWTGDFVLNKSMPVLVAINKNQDIQSNVLLNMLDFPSLHNINLASPLGFISTGNHIGCNFSKFVIISNLISCCNEFF